MTKHAENINYTILDSSREPKIDVSTFRGYVLNAVKELVDAATDDIAGLSDIHVEAMKFVWTDGKQRSEQDVFRLVQDVLHSVGDTTSSARKWLHKDGGRRMGSGTGGRHGQRKHDPILIPAGKFVFVSDSDDPKTAKLVDSRPLHVESELKFKIHQVDDLLPDFFEFCGNLRGKNAKIKDAMFQAAMSMAAKDRDRAIMEWHTGGRTIESARKAFQLIA